jgi:hypothetical protein
MAENSSNVSASRSGAGIPQSDPLWRGFGHFTSVITTPDERAGSHLGKADAPSHLAKFFKFVRGNISDDWKVLGSRLKVLTERQEVAVILPKVG